MLSHAMAFHSTGQNRGSKQSQYTTVCRDGNGLGSQCGRGLTAGTATPEFMEQGVSEEKLVYVVSAAVSTSCSLRPQTPTFATFSYVTSGKLVTFLSLPHLHSKANTISRSEHSRFRKLTYGSA